VSVHPFAFPPTHTHTSAVQHIRIFSIHSKQVVTDLLHANLNVSEYNVQSVFRKMSEIEECALHSEKVLYVNMRKSNKYFHNVQIWSTSPNYEWHFTWRPKLLLTFITLSTPCNNYFHKNTMHVFSITPWRPRRHVEVHAVGVCRSVRVGDWNAIAQFLTT